MGGWCGGPRAWALLVVFCGGFSAFNSVGWAGSRAEIELPSTETVAVQQGADFERNRKWVDAVEFYEKASKQWPENNHLGYALRRVKIQYSIDRRYNDRTFVDQLVSIPRTEAIAYFDDMLAKVRQYYVDSVTSTSFTAHGTESLYTALNNDKFLARNLPDYQADRVARFRKMLRDDYWNKPCPQKDSARQTVLEVCDKAHRELGLPAAPVVMEFVFGGCNSLDDYSSFLSPGRLDDLYNNIDGEFVGIGIEMKAEAEKGLLLLNVLPESPAEEGGAVTGDYIVSINGKNCRTLSTEEGATLLQGTPGSRLQLELYDPATKQTRKASLVRRAVKVKSIPIVKMLDRTSGIGYIRMTGFQKNTAEELDLALAQLNRENNLRALIWDLRGNPGGLLTAAVEVLDRFLDDGVVVSTKGRTADQNWSYTATRNGTWNVPLVVLIDGDSASASEIVAGAVHDHRRGTLVGRKTYGKWSVQSILPGRNNTGVRLTTARFYSPSGQTYGKVGLPPDIVVSNDDNNDSRRSIRNRRDPLADDRDIEMGLQVLRKELVQR